jgi:hypothetical protein
MPNDGQGNITVSLERDCWIIAVLLISFTKSSEVKISGPLDKSAYAYKTFFSAWNVNLQCVMVINNLVAGWGTKGISRS